MEEIPPEEQRLEILARQKNGQLITRIDRWRFTVEEKAALRAAVSPLHASSVLVNGFITRLEELCGGVFLLSRRKGRYEGPSRTETKDEIIRRIKSLQKASDAIQQLEKSPSLVRKPTSFEDCLPEGRIMAGRRFADLRDKAAAAREAIGELIGELNQEISSHQRKAGSPGTINLDFAVEIARAFYHCLQVTPTSTEGGLFCKVLELCFQAVGKELKDAHSLAVDALKY